ncbi:hypothetical protein B6U99_00080 [Candidatus Geothermarchaeota archaeon ex4572_27]|nr:MAG: hypothetical protein B6U99_00080 [Candidatus Geothermarchaeota archaeon ex4572_27]
MDRFQELVRRRDELLKQREVGGSEPGLISHHAGLKAGLNASSSLNQVNGRENGVKATAFAGSRADAATFQGGLP